MDDPEAFGDVDEEAHAALDPFMDGPPDEGQGVAPGAGPLEPPPPDPVVAPPPPRADGRPLRVRMSQLWKAAALRRLRLRADPHVLWNDTIPEDHRWAKVHATHSLRVTGSFLWCAHCGYYASSMTRRLRLPCQFDCSAAVDSSARERAARLARVARRRRLSLGKPPIPRMGWPSGHPHYTRFRPRRVFLS